MDQLMKNNDAPGSDPTAENPNFGSIDPWTALEEGQVDFSDNHPDAAPAVPGGLFDLGLSYQELVQLQRQPDITYEGDPIPDYSQDHQQPYDEPIIDDGAFDEAQIFPDNLTQDNSGHQVSYQQQIQSLNEDHHALPGGHSHDLPAPSSGGPELHPPVQPYNSYQQQAYPGYQPAHAPSQTSAMDRTPQSNVPIQQHGSASTTTTQKPKSRKRKRHDEQQDENDEDGEAKGKTKGEKGAETKKRKDQDKDDRDYLIGLRDDVADIVHKMATQHIPDWDEFEKAWKLLMELNKEIDGNTEKYLWWYGARPDRRGTDRAVPERKRED